MTSSAASQSLARLRTAFPEDLYVRQGGNYALTPYGERVIDGLRSIVRRWHEVELAARRFDPAACDDRFAVACVAHSAWPDLVRFHEEFRELAPRAQLDLQAPMHNVIDIQALRSGKLDILCASAPAPPDARDLHQELLCTHALTQVVLRRDHPRIGETLSLEQYLAEEHLVANYRNLDPATRSPLDAALLAMGRPMRRSTFVQSLWTCMHMAARCDHLMTMSKGGAEVLVKSTTALRSVPLPAELPLTSTELHMIWHERTHRSGAHQWLRERLRRAAQREPGT